MKKIIAITIATILGISTLGINSFATNISNQNSKDFQNREDFRKPENEIIGKITAISENSVTISLVDMKKPENADSKDFRTRPEEPNNIDDKSNSENENKPLERKQLTDEQIAEMKKKMEEMFSLTGETKTIDISSAKFDDFGKGPRDDKNDTIANNNETTNNKVEKTYKDYQVGDYIFVELESKESNKAKTVRDARWRQGGPSVQKREKKERQENKTNQ